jgi:hypothetical protein
VTARFVPYERVTLLTDRFAGQDAPRGSIGYVIEIHGDGAYEVEISDSRTGETRAQIVATAAELGPLPEDVVPDS